MIEILRSMRYRWAFWLLEGVFKVSLGTVQSCRSSYGTDFDHSEMASPV